MRVTVGDLALDLTAAQVAELQEQLGSIPRNTSGLLTTAQAAKRLGFGVDYVRDHAAELGGVKLSDGPKAPWRFPADLGVKKLTPATGEVPQLAPRRRAPRRAGSGQLLQSRG